MQRRRRRRGVQLAREHLTTVAVRTAAAYARAAVLFGSAVRRLGGNGRVKRVHEASEYLIASVAIRVAHAEGEQQQRIWIAFERCTRRQLEPERLVVDGRRRAAYDARLGELSSRSAGAGSSRVGTGDRGAARLAQLDAHVDAEIGERATGRCRCRRR